MSNYKTANLKPETMERLRNYAVGDESIDSTVNRLLDDSRSASGGVDDDHVREIKGRIDDLETSLKAEIEGLKR